ncbi:MAG: CHAD domain-containing protein [Chloroflexi bacterium]|nr:CHAD domain-containing protein [Chloroflexota bacterium]
MLKFLLPPESTADDLARWLPYCIIPLDAPSGAEHLTIYDTFDWRLYRQLLAFMGVGQRFTLHDLAANRVLTTAVLPDPPVYVWDLPHGLLRARLDPILEVRALLPQADVVIHTTPCQALDVAGQPVARLLMQEIRPSAYPATAPIFTLSIQPVAGQEAVVAEMAARLALVGVTAVTTDIYHTALAAAGQTPGAYSARLDIQLAPAMRADEATKAILSYLLQVMRANEAYILQDLDPEFLHDYRVAVRRTRSALSQIKAVFPPAELKRFRHGFKVIGRLSNRLRDLDVYLLAEEEYKRQLPDFLRGKIEPLFIYLRQQRAEALQEVRAGLTSAEYQQIVADWERVLAEPVDEKGATAVPRKAATPILILARRRIYKRYQQVIRAGRTILAEEQHGQMHALRIECKKLRYLMEFFASLFPAKEMGLLIRQLKQLQNRLGDLNDLNVQQAYLLHVADKLPLRHQRNRRALVAIGWLVANLEQKKAQAKVESAAAFSQFAAAENARLFAQLFAP